MFLLQRGRVSEQIFAMMPNSSRFIVLILILATVTRISTRTVESADLINSLQNPVIMAHNYPTMDNANDIEGKFCQIEYQVTRKRTGSCTKLAHGITGCISGEYVNPFHPECT